MSQAIKNTIEKMNQDLLDAQTAYYAGNPTMTDPGYDTLEAQLSALVATNPQYSNIATILTHVGVDSNSALRIPHAKPMLSIENYYTKESFVEAANNYGTWLLVEPKFDGNSAEIVFIDGVLTRAVSRGDGSSGEDMTAQVKACKQIPQYIITKIHDLRIRGEIVMRNSELARINSLGGRKYANSRNLVAGTLKQKDLLIVRSRELILMPWDMYSPTEDNLLPDSAYDRMKLAFTFGFPHPEGMKVTCNHILSELDRQLKINENSDITCDGVVLKADSHKVRNSLGVATKFTRFQHCYKPQNLVTTTTLLSIEYGLGRTGKVTPVAILSPVNLGGAMIGRASVCNETYMEALGLTIGCDVELVRSGDCIPYIVRVTKKGTKKIVFPTNCPSCNSILEFDPESKIIQRICINSNCAGKAAEQFAHVGNRETLEIDLLGDSMATELVSKGITNLADLFEFGNKIAVNPKSLTGFRSNVNTMKMVKSLEIAKTATWDRWLASMNIPMIGHSLGKDIAKALKLTSDNMGILCSLLLTLPKLNLVKLGPEKTASIVKWASNKDNQTLCIRLYKAGIRPTALEASKKSAPEKLNGIKFVMTGELSIGTRKVVAEQLTALGAEELSAVSSSCNLLIVGENPGSKLAKAQAKGIKIVDESWVKEQLG